MDDCLSSSQESLPLSDEAYMHLFKALGSPLNQFINDVDNVSKPANQEYPIMVDNVSKPADQVYPIMVDIVSKPANQEYCSMEQVSNSCHISPINPPINFINQCLPITIPQEEKRAPSSLPAIENWPGEYQFNVSFNDEEAGKRAKWIYARSRNKLYVQKDVPCPINFSTNSLMSQDVIIRTMALFSSAEHASEPVHRCINHSMLEIENKLPEAQHIIRCESNHAIYINDQITGRHCVIVPFANPPAGQQYSCYIYKFVCFGSCSGGPNRRPLMLVFTLEKGGSVIGRQKVDIKICASPSRDLKADEKQLNPDLAIKPEKQENLTKNTASSKRTKHEPFGLTPDTIKPVPKHRTMGKKIGHKEIYTIQTKDKECAKFLYAFKKLYPLIKKSKTQCQNLMELFKNFSSSEDEEKMEEN